MSAVGATVTHTLALTAYGNLNARDLAAFLDTVGSTLGDAVLTWTATDGGQRDPASLTLTARAAQ